jgi:hypothetical protein
VFTIAVVVIVIGLVGCGVKPIDPCQVHPTRTNVFGECVEYDSEACDSDPCDADDLVEHRKPSPAASKPKTSTTRRR